MSKLEVDAIEPQSGTTLTLGASGDSVNIASGATITDFTSTGIDDNATSTAITIDSSERVGIGTASPNGILELKSTGNTNFFITAGNTSASQVVLGDTDDIDVGKIAYSHNVNSMEFIVNASERMRIISNGSVGIGTTSPDAPLHIEATNASMLLSNSGKSQYFRIQNNETDDALVFNANDTNERMRINSSGHVIAPNLNTTGSTSNRYPLYWVHTGTTGSIEPYTGSIRAMKTDINDMSSVDWIYSLTPRSFKFRDYETDEDGNRTYLETTNNLPNIEYGLIAEEVNEVNGSDYILDKDENNNVKGVLYHNLVPILLKALQEQKTKNIELEARITALETQP